MTEKLFDTDPYNTDFIARVTEVADDYIILDRTLFFPEEGGQTCDRGTISFDGRDIALDSVSVSGDDILHHIKGASRIFSTGDMIKGHIDWAHRFDNMQNHTGEHIFSGIIHSRKGYDNVGFSLTETTCQMDYNGPLTDQEISEAELYANQIIWQNLPVECRYPSACELKDMDYRSKKELSGPIRIVTIPSVDVCACCAPHVGFTSEVGILKVISHMNYKGGSRLYIACGKRAYLDYTRSFDSLTRIGHMFSTGRSEAAGAVERLCSKNRQLSSQLNEALSAELKRQISSSSDNVIFTSVTDRNILTDAFNLLKESRSGTCYIFSRKSDNEYSFLAGGTDIDARTLLPPLKAIGARGGGKALMIQGSVCKDAEAIRAAVSR